MSMVRCLFMSCIFRVFCIFELMKCFIKMFEPLWLVFVFSSVLSAGADETLFAIDFQEHPPGGWDRQYGVTPFPKPGFATVVEDLSGNGNRFAAVRYDVTAETGDLNPNWKGLWFNNPIPALSPGQAIEFSFDCRLFLDDRVVTKRFFECFLSPVDYVGQHGPKSLRGPGGIEGLISFDVAQSNWDKGGVTPDGNLLVRVYPNPEAKLGVNINLHDIGASRLGQSDADTESDELRIVCRVRKSEQPGFWHGALEVSNKVSGVVWEDLREIENPDAYYADELFAAFFTPTMLTDSCGYELDNIQCRMLYTDRPLNVDQEDSLTRDKLSLLDFKPIRPESVLLRSVSAARKNIREDIVRLNEGLKRLPASQESLQFDAYGYHGGYLPRLDVLPENPRWTLDVFFPSDRLDQLVLVPAFDRRFDQAVSYGFPRRFRVLLVDGKGASRLIHEWTDQDFEAPGRTPVILDVSGAKPSHNTIRIEVYRGAVENHRELFALDEIYGVAKNEIAQARHVTASSELESPPYWGKEYLIDQKTHLGLPLGPAVPGCSDEDYRVVLDNESGEVCVVELDLGKNRMLGWITLFPARPTDGVLIPGYGFPGNIKVELIPEARKGMRGNTLYLPDGWSSGAPANNVVRIPAYSNSARWIRLICSDFPVHNGERTFALGEVHVYKGGQSYPIDEVALSGVPTYAERDKERMIDGLVNGKPVMFLMDWLHQIEKQHHWSNLLENRESAEEFLRLKWLRFWRITTWSALSVLAVSGLVITVVLVVLRRRSLFAMNFRLEQERHLTELEQMKIRFFTHISHELRTPLTVILGPLEKLYEVQKEARFKEYAALALRNVKKLQGLVDQLLDFRKLQDGREVLERREVNMIEHMRNAFEVYRSLALDKQIDYRLSLPEVSCWVLFDADKFQKITDNLISNALKYTPSTGQVWVALSVREAGVDAPAGIRLMVEDSGSGISAEDLPHVFEQYYRADGLESVKAVGSGIGLALVKELVDLMEGSISVDSPVIDGHGSRFTVQVPVDIVSGQAEAVPVPDAVESAVSDFAAEEESVQTTDAPGAKLKVLVIDDHADIRTFVGSELADSYTVIEAADGEAGWQQVRAEMPDLVISDVMMPVMNGIELCKRIKTDEKTSHIPVILLTARGSVEHQVEGLETGADDYISKPFSMPVLQLRIHNLLEARRMMRERFCREITVEPSEITVTSVDERFLQKAIKVVEEHMDDLEFGVAAFADAMYMDRKTLLVKLKAIVDQTPRDFVRILRLKRARQLLEQSGESVSEIAFQCGFSEVSNFSRSFKTQFGVSPTVFRNNMK